MIKYYIPDFFYNYNINLGLLETIQNRPYMFYDDFKIGGIFGTFPNNIWNGGGISFGRFVSDEEMILIRDNFASYGVPLRLTITNPSIEEKHLYDSYANYILKTLEDGFTQVLVSSPLLEEYIRSEYPKYPIIRSILAAENIYYDDSNKYYMSVLRKHKNNDFEFLKSIEHKDKIEILVNEICDPNCPRAYSHYKDMAKRQLLLNSQNDFLQTECAMPNREDNYYHFFTRFQNLPFSITREKIKTIYEPMGFTNFKIAGRNHPIGTRDIMFYAHYMVKPEYQFDFIANMMYYYEMDGK